MVGATPRSIAFGASATVPEGTCSSALAIQVRDGFGNITSVGAEFDVALSSSSNTTRFFAETDTRCLSPLVPASVRVPRGAGTGFFRFIDATPGFPLFDASARDAGVEGPSVAPATSQAQTVL